MKHFIERFDDRLLGVLSGFDRLRFRGTLLLLTSEGGMMEFLWRNKVLLKDFKAYAFPLTERVRLAGERLAAKTPSGKVHSLSTTRISKEEFVRNLTAEHSQREGLLAVLSCVEDDPQGECDWRALRKGVADLYRRATVSQAAHARYVDQLAAVDNETTVAEASGAVCRRVTEGGRTWRALNPLAEEDARLLAAVSRGEFSINGFRNRDLRALLYPTSSDPDDRRRRSMQVTRN